MSTAIVQIIRNLKNIKEILDRLPDLRTFQDKYDPCKLYLIKQVNNHTEKKKDFIK